MAAGTTNHTKVKDCWPSAQQQQEDMSSPPTLGESSRVINPRGPSRAAYRAKLLTYALKGNSEPNRALATYLDLDLSSQRASTDRAPRFLTPSGSNPLLRPPSFTIGP